VPESQFAMNSTPKLAKSCHPPRLPKPTPPKHAIRRKTSSDLGRAKIDKTIAQDLLKRHARVHPPRNPSQPQAIKFITIVAKEPYPIFAGVKKILAGLPTWYQTDSDDQTAKVVERKGSATNLGSRRTRGCHEGSRSEARRKIGAE